ncbi:hypothetical protein [Luteolibacter sp. LG18]|uniref:hypothetical protein n=1 Tax=Luteolibacter sp. LG18 TaxID=2819286 RepID=UPI002B2B414D|nr:hypothetical protein llg_11520 [Luteolibacter sp. LG18]
MSKASPILACFLLSSACLFAGTELTVKDKTGRSMEIEIVGVTGDKVSFNRKSDGKRFELPLSTFDEESAKQISAAKAPAASTSETHPNYAIDVVVEKRRKKNNGSDYLVRQEVSAKVVIKNPERTVAGPKAKVRLLYLGEDRSTGKEHSVLGVRDYEIQIAAGMMDARNLDAVTTVYDSDNKGAGNIGGDQYEGYFLVILDSKDNVVQQTGSCAKLNEILKSDPTALKPLLTVKANAHLDAKYNPTGRTVVSYR